MVIAIFDWFDKDPTRVDVNHDHEIVVAGQRAVGEFAGLVGKDGVAGVVYVGVQVVQFAANELGRLKGFKGNGLLFCGPDVFFDFG